MSVINIALDAELKLMREFDEGVIPKRVFSAFI